MLRICLMGGTGQLGRRLAVDLASLGEVITPTRQELDATKAADVEQWLKSRQFDLIVNALAMTAVDQAETALELALQLNQHFVRQLAEYAAAQKIWLIHFSTDYVFDGEGDRAWQESDPCLPLQQYGHSKRAGELAIIASGCLNLILRTSWLYDHQGQNFLLTMLQLAQQSQGGTGITKQSAAPLKIVADQIGAPTYTAALSVQVTRILEQLLKMPLSQARHLSGIYNLCAEGHCSWFDFAHAIFTEATEQGLLEQAPQMIAISSTELTRPAIRPKNSRLDTRKVQSTFQLQLTNWQQQLAQCLTALKNAAKTGK